MKEIILSSQETGVLYLYESSSGFVFKSVGDEKIQPIYKGEITNGKPNGFGILSYPYNENSVVGEWKNGKEWNTKHTKKDGTLIGKFVNGRWEEEKPFDPFGDVFNLPDDWEPPEE